MKNYSTKIDGKTIIYRDSVVAVTTTSFTFWQRLQILFGCKLCTQTQIFLREPTTALGQKTESAIVRLPKKQSNDQSAKS